MTRATRIALATAALNLIAAAPASAGTVSMSGATVSFQASPGETNHVKVTHLLGVKRIVIVQDTGAPLTASGDGCVAVGGRATCVSIAAIRSAQVSAGDRNDTVTVADFIAEVHGGDGADTITTGGLADTLRGDAGDDYLNGAGGDNTELGGVGNDTLTAGNGKDTLSGGAGNDRLLAGGSNDSLSGEAGNDFLFGDNGDDVLDGGTGADTLRGGRNGFDVDTATYADRTAPVDVTPGTGPDDGEAGEHDDIAPDVERIIGGSGNDHMVGFVDGTPDGYPSEVLMGGLGDDDLTVYAAGSAVGGPGDDTLTAHRAGSLVGGPGNDHLIGSDEGDYMEGDDGADTLDGNGGDDTVLGGLGDDIENAGAGNDDIDDHQGGADSIDAGPGDDRMYLVDPVDVRGGSGHDNFVSGATGTGSTVSLDDLANDSLGGRPSNVHSDVEDFVGTFYDDVIVGSASANRLFGGIGNDTIEGKGGADLLVGGSGNSNLILARDGEADEVSCGPGAADTAQVDPVETIVDGCETLLP